MGNQGHAAEGIRLMREWVEAGLIGKVVSIEFYTNRPIWPQGIRRPSEAHNVPPTLDWELWLGPAPFRLYHPAYAPFNWRGWWDFGTGARRLPAPQGHTFLGHWQKVHRTRNREHRL